MAGQDALTAAVRKLQIVVAAMCAGCLTFLAIAVIVGRNGQSALVPIVSYIAVGVAVLQLVVRLIVPGIIVAQGRKKILRETTAGESTDEWTSKLMPLMMTKTIFAAAILEGATFFLLIAYLVEKTPWVLAFAIALVVGIALHLPTQSSAQAWMDSQLRRLGDERHFGK